MSSDEVTVAAEALAGEPSRCCAILEDFLDREGSALREIPEFREVVLERPGVNSVQRVNFCPFCGEPCPPHLRDEWFARLARLGFHDPLVDDADQIPCEFRSSAWWRGSSP